MKQGEGFAGSGPVGPAMVGSSLAVVRRLEAAAFRAWPATAAVYDGTWLIRLTPGHGSKRLNSINPLDPSDSRDIEPRLAAAAVRFAKAGRVLTVRQSPLTPPPLIAHLDAAGWTSLSESLVMAADLADPEQAGGMDLLPVRDLQRFADARAFIDGETRREADAVAAIIASIEPETGLFLFEDRVIGPAAVCLVVHDADLAGILQLAVLPAMRRQGTGSAILAASLRWARLHGARTAWLQVDAGNRAARSLYETFGFRAVYRYLYRRPPA